MPRFPSRLPLLLTQSPFVWSTLALLADKEHLANFRAFEKALGRDGAAHPTKRRLPLGQGCVSCCFEIGDAMFCEVCGEYPAQRKPPS